MGHGQASQGLVGRQYKGGRAKLSETRGLDAMLAKSSLYPGTAAAIAFLRACWPVKASTQRCGPGDPQLHLSLCCVS